MIKCKYISFDLDGTLIDEKHDLRIWNEILPAFYAKKNNLSLNEAKNRVHSEYDKVIIDDKNIYWSDIFYWFKKFGLENWKKFLLCMKANIFVYNDSKEILEYLSKKYKLIVISNTNKKFLDIKIKVVKLNKYFKSVFSVPSTFGITKKNEKLYLEVLKKLNIKSNQIAHIGNNYYEDYIIPSNMGIKSYFLDRFKNIKDKYIIHSLLDLKNIF